MIELATMLALTSVLATAVVFGTDVFCALVQRPALAAVDDRALVAVMGNVHRYGDRRMPVPGVLGGGAAVASATLFAVAGQWTQAILAVSAVAVLLAWIALYVRVSAPINRQLTAAAAAAGSQRMPARCSPLGIASLMLAPSCRVSHWQRCASRWLSEPRCAPKIHTRTVRH